MASMTLIIEHDMLATPGELCRDHLLRRYYLKDGSKGLLLVFRYDAGDIDTFHWPITEYMAADFEKKLRGALYDMREMGGFPSDVDVAILPDGSKIGF